MKKVTRKIVSAVTAFALTFQFVCIEGLFNRSVIASSYVNGKAKVTLGDIDVDIKDKLEDNGDGSYNLTVELGSSLSANDESTNRLVSEDGYYVAPIAGRYLIEIWGGAGATGGNSIEYNPSWTGILGKGGSSGAGGHVYGIVELDRGDVLWYEVGGNGAQEESWMSGGGANSGGNSLISFKTGGGGGYSAVYLFSGSDFSSGYLDANGNLAVSRLTADDHNSRYIMIAGGGGGGGAGCLYHASASAVASPDGGAGGSMTSPTVTLGNTYPVAGVVYCGGNGTSSGKDTSYIGIGGSAVPGESPATKHGWADTIDPNNWAGTLNRWSGYGGGGSSNLRGGGGGAGFAGGSGGVMRSITVSTNVGGGGGGSSFVASSLSAADPSILLSGGNPSSNGGAVYIAYLDKTDYPQYEDVELQFDASEYFDVSSSSSGVSINGSEVTFSGINLLSDESATAVFTFTPKSNFLGGNKVPLFESDFVLTADSENVNMALSEDCSYVNVPITFDELTTNKTLSYDKSELPVTVGFSSLFDEVDTSTFNTDYIDMNSSFIYSVVSEGASVSNPITLSASATSTVFNVSYKIVPSGTEVAKIGSVATTKTVSNTAPVTITFTNLLEIGTGANDGVGIGDNDDGVGYEVVKSLTYDEANNQYVLDLGVTGYFTQQYTNFTNQQFTSNGTFTAPVTGYYAVQSWGGDGGHGGTATIVSGNIGVGSTEGSDGGKGAYVCGLVYLEAGQSFDVTVGSVGAIGSTGSGNNLSSRSGNGGEPGTPTSVVGAGVNCIVAAGGGGGGGYRYSLGGSNSGNVGNDGSSENSATPTAATAGGKGKASEIIDVYVIFPVYDGGAAGGKGGTSSYSFNASTSNLSSYGLSIYDTLSTNNRPDNGGNGACIVTLLDSEIKDLGRTGTEVLPNRFSDFSMSYVVSPYFDVEKITATSIDISSTEKKTIELTSNLINNTDGSVTLNTQDFLPAFGMGGGMSADLVATLSGSIETSIKIYLVPKDDFLGGNNVPILDFNGDSSYTTGMTIHHGEYSADIAKQEDADYANVLLNTSVLNLTATDTTIVLGDSVDIKDLFSSTTVDPDTWEGDFADIIELDNQGSVSPTETTTYERSVTIKADETTGYAVVGPYATSETITDFATVAVELSVTYSLTDLTSLSDNPSKVGINDTLYVGLGLASGYTYPESVSVSVGGTTLDSSGYSYDSSKGTIIVPAEKVTGNIVITAVGVAQKYKIHLAYQTYDNGEFTDVMPDGWPKEYFEGESIQSAVDAVAEVVPDTVPGYTFSWSWTTEDGKPCNEMPARDLYIIGSYEANIYDLTINYYEEGTTNTLATQYTDKYHYGEDYYIESPSVYGYVPLTVVVSGTMDADETNDTINVYYEKIENEVWVQFVSADGSVLIDSVSGNELVDYKSGLIALDEPYEYTMPVVTGYTPDVDSISGNMTADGVYVKVTYSPNTYELTLDPDGGDIGTTPTTRIVKYNDIFSHVFDLTEGTDSYEALPIPVKLGYEFTGWYLDGDTTTPLSSDSLVIPSDSSDMSKHTLKAGWNPIKTNVTVEYVFEDDTKALDTKTVEATYGVNYDVPSPIYDDAKPTEWTNLRGYTPDITSVSGVGGIEDVNEKVTYIANEYTLIIKYLDKDDNPLVDIGGNAIDDYVQTIKFGESYSVTSPDPDTIPNMVICNDPVVQGTIDADALDDMVNGELVIKVYYSADEYYHVTVEWGSLEFECDFDANEWNPKNHTYIDSVGVASNSAVFTPVADENYIKIINNSSNSVDVVLEYNAYTGYESIVGTFENSEFNVAANGSHTEFLELSGTFNDHFVSSITAGSCNVEISGGK